MLVNQRYKCKVIALTGKGWFWFEMKWDKRCNWFLYWLGGPYKALPKGPSLCTDRRGYWERDIPKGDGIWKSSWARLKVVVGLGVRRLDLCQHGWRKGFLVGDWRSLDEWRYEMRMSLAWNCLREDDVKETCSLNLSENNWNGKARKPWAILDQLSSTISLKIKKTKVK